MFQKKSFVEKTIRIIQEKYQEINDIYILGIKKGLSTGGIRGELNLIERDFRRTED
ncbi:MAG: hypothetical protein IKF11_11200 [Methanobrevibacter sp.]|nr:hypothetical protein [Methanobrevibacter sp.]